MNEDFIKEIQNIAKGLYQLNISSNINDLINLIEISPLFKDKDFNDALIIINNFLANKDYILLADFLNFELINNINSAES